MSQLSSGHVFMSYSRRDDIVMRRIVTFLRNKGIKVWVDNEKLIPGTPIWEEEIEKAINSAPAVIVVLSPDAKNSEWVRREISLADQYRRRVFPVLVRGDQETSISLRLINRQFVDIRENEEAGLNQLETALSQYLQELKGQEQKAKSDAQKLAREKAKREAAEKAKLDLAAKEEAERLAAESFAKEESQRLAAQKAKDGNSRTGELRREKDELAAHFKTEQDKFLKEKAELEERLKEERNAREKIESDRLAADKAEAKREAENLAKRVLPEAELVAASKAEIDRPSEEKTNIDIERIADEQVKPATLEINVYKSSTNPPDENAEIRNTERTIINLKSERKSGLEEERLADAGTTSYEELATSKKIEPVVSKPQIPAADQVVFKKSRKSVFPKVGNTWKNWGAGKKLLVVSGIFISVATISCLAFFIWFLRPLPEEQPVQIILPGGSPIPFPTNTVPTTVYEVVFSPNGEYLATAGSKYGIQIWNVKSGTLVNTTSEVFSFAVAFSPDGKSIAYSSGNTIYIERISDKVIQNTFTGHTSFIYDLAFSPNGQTIASGANDKTVRLWSIDDNTLLKTFNEHTSAVTSVAFSPDGQLLATGSDSIRIWNIIDGKLIKTLEGLTDYVVFSPDGQFLASSYSSINLWSTNNYELFQTFDVNTPGNFSFSPDSQIIATGSYSHSAVELWNVETATKLKNLDGHTNFVRNVKFSPDGTLLASGSDDGTIRLWDISSLGQ